MKFITAILLSILAGNIFAHGNHTAGNESFFMHVHLDSAGGIGVIFSAIAAAFAVNLLVSVCTTKKPKAKKQEVNRKK